jgi:glycerophosphoryl diester phosphodiesterase
MRSLTGQVRPPTAHVQPWCVLWWDARRVLPFLLVLLFLAPASAERVKVIGHRGASSLAPENTLASFRKAIELGVDYIELDVWDSLDDSLMVIHDNDISRTTNGTGFVTALTYTQLRRYSAGSWFAPEFAAERIPTLREVLTLARDMNTRACIEIKNTQVTAAVVNLVTAMGMDTSVFICCFYLDALQEVRQIRPLIQVVYFVDPVTQTAVDTLKAIGGQVVGSGNGNTQAMIDYAHQVGVAFWPWTVDIPARMIEYIGRGVDGIITNYPQTLIAIEDSLSTDVQEESPQPPAQGTLDVFPNPFNSSTIVRFTVPSLSPVSLEVYNILGQRVALLVDGQTFVPGEHTIPWDAGDIAGGSYVIVMRSAAGTCMQRTLLLK